jgi:hypothetical protein
MTQKPEPHKVCTYHPSGGKTKKRNEKPMEFIAHLKNFCIFCLLSGEVLIALL